MAGEKKRKKIILNTRDLQTVIIAWKPNQTTMKNIYVRFHMCLLISIVYIYQ